MNYSTVTKNKLYYNYCYHGYELCFCITMTMNCAIDNHVILSAISKIKQKKVANGCYQFYSVKEG